MELNSKIIYSIDQMISDAILKLQYYGEFCQFINFKKSSTIETCGVTVDLTGMIFLYNEEFLNELDQEEINFVMLHEIFHLLWDHISRRRRLGYEHKLSNVAQDMIINTVIQEEIIKKMEDENKRENRNARFAKIPVSKEDNKVWVLIMPPEYKGKHIYEELYDWLFEEKKKYDDWKDKKEKKCPVSDYLRRIFEQLDFNLCDFLDSHLPSDLPDEYKKSIIENVKNYLRNRDLEKENITKALDKLNKCKKDHLKDIKISISELFGTHKEKSITKRNRRSIQGLKGKRKDAYALNVLLDTSGSMDGYFEKSLSYVFQNDLVINLIQCDTKVSSYTLVRTKSEFRKIVISGLGGTELQPGVNYISKQKELRGLNTLILTDGLCDSLDVTKLNKVLIISHEKKVKVTGKVKQIILKDE